MKKFVVIALSALMAVPAFAVNGIADENQVIEQEQGAMDPAELEATSDENTFYRSSTGEAIVGGVIGGIIGAIAADRWDRDNGYRPGRPGRPGADRWVTCYAQNRRGETFRATARRARMAQDQAMRKCYQYSRACRPLGCR